MTGVQTCALPIYPAPDPKTKGLIKLELVLDFYEHSIPGLASTKFAKEVRPALDSLVTMVIDLPYCSLGGHIEGRHADYKASLNDLGSGCPP